VIQVFDILLRTLVTEHPGLFDITSPANNPKILPAVVVAISIFVMDFNPAFFLAYLADSG
jgi:hypothetical protein